MNNKRKITLYLSAMLLLSALSASPFMGASQQLMMAPDAGDSWTDPVILNNGTTFTSSGIRFPLDMATDSAGNIHVLFTARWGISADSYEIYYTMFNGSSWTTPVNITQNTIQDKELDMFIDGEDNIHVAYVTDLDSEEDVFYITKTALGWSTPVNVSTNTYIDRNPCIVADSQGVVHVMWTNYHTLAYHLYYANNSGGSWNAPLELANSSALYDPDMGIDNQGNIHIIWSGDDYYQGDLDLMYTTNVGGSWNTQAVTNSSSIVDEEYSQIAVNGNGTVNIVCKRNDPSYIGIIFITGVWGSWSTPVSINATTADNYWRSISLDASGNSHIVFMQDDDADPNYELFYTNNTQGVFGTPVNVTSGTDNIEYVEIVITPDQYANVVYHNIEGVDTLNFIRSTEPVWEIPSSGDLTLIIVVTVVAVIVVAGVAFYLLRIRKP